MCGPNSAKYVPVAVVQASHWLSEGHSFHTFTSGSAVVGGCGRNELLGVTVLGKGCVNTSNMSGKIIFECTVKEKESITLNVELDI